MPCLDEDTITDLLAGRLRLDAAGVEEHLHTCPTCARLIGLTAADLDGPPQIVGTSPITIPTESRNSQRDQHVYDLANGTRLNDTYEILRPIGRGGMGEVYEVRHVRLAGRYAVKILLNEVSGDEDLLSRFRREADITSALHHPHIVQVIDFDRTPEGCWFLAMEYMDGCDLAALLQREGKLSLPRAFRILSQIVAALTAAHRQGIVHRDLKPANIFVLRDPDDGGERIKLMDFGLSKRSSTALDVSLAYSQDRALIGTPMYMAPEQARGQNREVTAATDQFALATIFFELLTGSPAFPGANLGEVLYKISHGPPASLVQHRPDLQAVEHALNRAFSKAQDDRFGSVQDFFRAIERAATWSLGLKSSDLPRKRAGQRRWRRIAAVGLVAGLSVLGLIVGRQVRIIGSGIALSRATSTPAGSAATTPAPAAVEPPRRETRQSTLDETAGRELTAMTSERPTSAPTTGPPPKKGRAEKRAARPVLHKTNREVAAPRPPSDADPVEPPRADKDQDFAAQSSRERDRAEPLGARDAGVPGPRAAKDPPAQEAEPRTPPASTTPPRLKPRNLIDSL